MSLALKYAMKKRMAKGGDVKGVHAQSEGQRRGVSVAGENLRYASDAKNSPMNRLDAHHDAKHMHEDALRDLKSMRDKDRRNFAEGGMCEHGSTDCDMCHGGKMMAHGGDPNERKEDTLEQKGVHQPSGSAGQSVAGYLHSIARDENGTLKRMSKDEHRQKLSELRSMKGHDRRNFADGGFVDEEESTGYESEPAERPGYMYDHATENQGFPPEEDDMVGRIMQSRMLSEGGEIANDDAISADFEPNEFDDLAKDDGLEEHYTGANSGDEIGNATEDGDRGDMISRIMQSRRKKDRMPYPA